VRTLIASGKGVVLAIDAQEAFGPFLGLELQSVVPGTSMGGGRSNLPTDCGRPIMLNERTYVRRNGVVTFVLRAIFVAIGKRRRM
jgi:hypothetical protein